MAKMVQFEYQKVSKPIKLSEMIMGSWKFKYVYQNQRAPSHAVWQVAATDRAKWLPRQISESIQGSQETKTL